MPDWDDPTTIINESIQAQKRILSGYKAHPRLNKERYHEALKPKHVAISLAGEPSLYPRLGDLIHEFHKRGFTTFIVTNGTIPEALENLSEEPSQLYISVTAPDKSTYREVCRPQIAEAWEKLNQTLDLLSSFKCPTVLRLTLVRHLNLKNPEKYAKLIEKANPTYVEPKAYMFVGMSRLRLSFDNMPTYMEVKEFGNELSDLTGYKMIDESINSRVMLLSRLEKANKLV